MATKKPSTGGRGRPKSDASLTADEGEEEEGAEEANVIPLDIGIPVGDRTQLADEAGGKPAAAAWATDRNETTLLNLQRDILKGVDGPFCGSVVFRDRIQLDHREAPCPIIVKLTRTQHEDT